jgi:hypothetical protein
MALTAAATGLFVPTGLGATLVRPAPQTPAAAGPYGPDVPPLFASEAPLEIRIESDFGQIRRDRADENPEYQGLVFVREAGGGESEWPVQIRTRGNFRLMSRICEFPPIRLNFPKRAVEGGVFEGQDKIKLVTHCRDRYEQQVLREYLAYRIFNQITDESFRVRMAHVTYVDTSGREDPLTRVAFFIEMEEALADRLGGTVIPDEELAAGLHPARILGPNAVRVDLFAYMVGNTDYTMYFPSVNGGLHNIVPVQRENGTVVAVPYDFDLTGLVDAPYAEPSEEVEIRRVTDRIYRGVCRPGLDYGAAYAEFTTRKPVIESMIAEMDLMEDDERRDVTRFLDDFWRTIEDDGRARQRIERACRPT